MNNFEIIATDANCSARRGLLHTAHGTAETPVFMPIGTRGAVKGLLPEQLAGTGSKILLANTYHMMLRPGVEVVEKLGGLHKLMAWDGPILTDSGGYQVFSLSTLNRIGDDGVEFASHIDGAKFYIDARIATTVQNKLGADIIMCFDECAPLPCEKEHLERAVQRTIRWAQQCKESHSNPAQMLFGIVQGGTDTDLRTYCTQALAKMDFSGYAIGGLSVGESFDEMITTVEHTAPLLPAEKPRYLMGVGTPTDIIAAVRAGIDMFDCCLPTRNGRNGTAFTSVGIVKMRNSKHIDDAGPVDSQCDCYGCRNFTKAAVRHFFNVGEMLGPVLLSLHNIRFYQKLMETIRSKIEIGQFDSWAEKMISKELRQIKKGQTE